MSLSYDLARAESDVAHINLDKEYNELITDIEAVYSHHRHTFKNSLGENSGEIVDLLIEHCKKDFFAYAALVYVLCVEAEMSNEAVLSYIYNDLQANTQKTTRGGPKGCDTPH